MRQRIDSIDILRGLAIVLMVVDHVALVCGWPWYLRLPGRFAMPLFMMLSGYLWRGHRWDRMLIILIVAIAVTPLERAMNITQFNILFMWLLAQSVMPLIVRYPAPAAALGLISTQCFILWPGVHIGFVVAYLAIGRMIDFSAITLPRVGVLSLTGRWPVTCYAGHIVVLASTIILI